MWELGYRDSAPRELFVGFLDGSKINPEIDEKKSSAFFRFFTFEAILSSRRDESTVFKGRYERIVAQTQASTTCRRGFLAPFWITFLHQKCVDFGVVFCMFFFECFFEDF